MAERTSPDTSAGDGLALVPRGEAGGGLSPIDRALGDLLARHGLGDPAARRVLALTGALLGHQRAAGHSCVDLGAWAGRPLPGGSPTTEAAEPTRLPNRDAWRRALEASGLATDADDLDPASPTPLVLDGQGRLHLWRYFEAERRLLDHLRQRLRGPSTPEPTAATRELFGRLFPPPEEPAVDWQAVAAAVALDQPLTLISGGPGTGKTTTVCRLLALATHLRPDLRIALAAPTGKAAARLAESIANQVDGLPLGDSAAELRGRIPRQATTLHRLLGYHPQRETFRHHPGHPLTCDLLVVDETSMVDLLMMDAVLAALAPSARLVLLGDQDQLTSVETGFVFADLCRTAARRRPSPELRRHWSALSGRAWPEESPSAEPSDDPSVDLRAEPPALEQRLADSAVTLRYSFRFRGRPGIGALAEALRRGDGEGALAVLADPGFDDVELLPLPDRSAEDFAVCAPIEDALIDLVGSTDASEALERLGRFRILAPHRQGPWGVEALNRRVDDWLRDRQPPTASDTSHPQAGRPLMIVRNDRQLQLFNGDVGVCWPEPPERPEAPPALGVYFSGGEDGVRRLAPGKLPPHETAWAMTVHKSQGSEFDRVLLVLGDQDSPLLSRELLYTAVTRARRTVTVVGTAELVVSAAGRVTRRTSGLPHLLGLEPTPPPPVSESSVSSRPTEPPTEPEEPERPTEDPHKTSAPVQLRLFGD